MPTLMWSTLPPLVWSLLQPWELHRRLVLPPLLPWGTQIRMQSSMHRHRYLPIFPFIPLDFCCASLTHFFFLQDDASTEPTQPVSDYTPALSVSSPARPFQSVDTAGESIEFPLQISDSDSDSVTSPATHLDSSSTSSDSSLSSTSLQDPQEPVCVDTNKQQSSQATPLSTASPQVTSQTTLSAASPSTFPVLAIKPSTLEAIARLCNLVK